MRQFLWVVTVLAMAVTIAGCGLEKGRVETYLQEHQASQETMTAFGEELKRAMLEVKASQAAGEYQPDDVKSRTQAIEAKMRAQRAKFEAVVAPEKCQTLKAMTLEQYDAVIAVLAKTPELIDASERFSESLDALREAPREKKQDFLVALKPVEAKLQAVQAESVELADSGTRAQRAAEEEKRRLQEEFGLVTEPQDR